MRLHIESGLDNGCHELGHLQHQFILKPEAIWKRLYRRKTVLKVITDTVPSAPQLQVLPALEFIEAMTGLSQSTINMARAYSSYHLP